MKLCSSCKTHKPLAAFQADSRYKSGFVSWCKECKKESAKKHPDTIRTWIAENKERVTANKNRYVQNNPDKVKASRRRWYENNKKVQLAYTRKYQASKLQASPKWLTQEQLQEMANIYKNCPEGYEVDHTVPLQGKTVRGLHVPWNLQYLPISVNRKKSNKVA